MKKVIAMLAILMVFACAAFAVTSGETASLFITLTIEEGDPSMALLGSTSKNGEYKPADVAFGTLTEADVKKIAYFKVQYGAYSSSKTITVSATATALACEDTTTTGAASVSAITDATMNFGEGDGTAGEFAAFNVTYSTAGLAPGYYTSTVQVIYTINS